MTSDQIAARVQRDLAEFRYAPPKPGQTVGAPWSAGRVARGVEALRAGLLAPYPVTLTIPDALGRLGLPPERRPAWVVGRADSYVVFFDPAAGEYGLAEPDGDGAATDAHVRGDLVGTFLAA